MRREYRKIILTKIKKGDFSYLATQGLKIPLIWLGDKIGKPLTGPIQAILLVTYRCNLKCQICDLWSRPGKKKEKELSTKKFLEIIGDLASLGTTGIGFTGGEPFLRSDIFKLINNAHQKGMVTHIATNGLLLDKRKINQLLLSGLDAISFSLDGPNAITHDKIRSKKGSFDKLLRNIKLLDQARKKQQKNISLVINCAISQLNADKILDLVEKAPELGVDSVGFIPVQESGLGKRKSQYKNKLKVKNNQKINHVLDRLIKIKKKRPQLIDNTVSYLEMLKDFFAGKDLPIPCLVGYHTCLIDGYGDLFPCIPFSNLDQPTVNLKHSSLKKTWQSDVYQKTRQEINNCRRCYWNCHTEVNLMFNKPR